MSNAGDHPYPPSRQRRLIALFWGLISTMTVSAATLFSTDFETYRVGDDLLVGQDGWTATGTGTGISGVLADAVTGLGRSAFIGYGFPSSSPIRLFHGLGLPASDPLPTRISLQGLAGVAASGAGDDDLFRIAIRLRDGSMVASVVFNLRTASYGIWSATSVSQSLSSVTLSPEHLYGFVIELDLERQVWSAHLDGFPVVTQGTLPSFDAEQIRSATMSFEWEITTLSNPGDNWMIFDELKVTSEDPLAVSLHPRSGGGIDISWNAPVAGTYQAQWSQDLSLWQSLGSPAKATTPGEALSVVGPASTAVARFYRITHQTP
jgi:hypothetical protein